MDAVNRNLTSAGGSRSAVLLPPAAAIIHPGPVAAMATYFACEAAVTVARQAVQIHGGNGVTRDFMVEKLAVDRAIVVATDVSDEDSVQTVDEGTLIALCKNQRGSAKSPKSLEFCADLPRSAVGKLLK